MVTFNIPEMSCGHCKATVEKAIQSVDALADIKVDLDTRTVAVNSASGSAEAVIAALKDSGYEATVAG